MPTVRVEGAHGVVEGITSYDELKDVTEDLQTETVLQGLRIKFVPTRFALEQLLKRYGKESFAEGCRFAWGHFWKKQERATVDFEFVTNPYDHQRDIFEHIKDLPYFALEWEMGLGKSKTILDVCQYAASLPDDDPWQLDALLVITLKGVHEKWVYKEVPTHLPKDFADAAYWQPGRADNGMWFGPDVRNRTALNKSKKFVVATINFESVHRKKGLEFCQKLLRTRKCAIVIDESQHIKSPTAATTKAVLKLGKLAVRRWITTGTVSSGSTVDPFKQYEFLDPKIVGGMNYNQWKAEFTEQTELGDKTYEAWEYNPALGRRIKVEKPVLIITGYKNEDKLAAMLDPYRSRLLKKDCINLPDKLYRMRSFELSNEMRSAYEGMLQNFKSELKGGRTMTATMAMTKLVRLQQIACGFVTPDDLDPLDEGIPGERIGLRNPRIEALMEEVEKAPNGIVWAYWRYSLREIADALREAYGDAKVVEYHGGISTAEKAKALIRFQEEGTADWFVANPQSGGTGIDLFRTSFTFYFNNSFNLIQRLQSEDRTHRIGQTEPCTYTDIEALGTVDRPQLRALKDKKDVAALISGDTLTEWLTSAV